MTVKIVTDSTSDIPANIVKELGITVIPLYVRFGEKVFRDGVDISAEQFFEMLTTSPALPTTSQPSAGDFQVLYETLSEKNDEILSIHISKKLSGTCESAMSARKMIKKKCRIEIIDALQATMGTGLLVMKASKLASSGASLDQILENLKTLIPHTYVFGALDTLEYLRKGGRIGKASAFLGSLLNVKPIIIVKDGEVHPLERVRGRNKLVDRLKSLVQEYKPVDQLSVLYSTTKDEAQKLAGELSGILNKDDIYVARFGAVLGTYMGPGSLGLALIKKP